MADEQQQNAWYVDEKLLAALFGEEEPAAPAAEESTTATQTEPEPVETSSQVTVESPIVAVATPEPETSHAEDSPPDLCVQREPGPAAAEPEEALAEPTEAPPPPDPPQPPAPPPQPNPWSQASEHVAAQRFDAAMEIYRQLLEATPEDPALHYNAAVCLQKLGDHANAREQFSWVLARDSEFSEARIGLAWSSLHARDAEQALALFEQQLLTAPQDERALSGRAQALHLLSRFEEACSAYEQMGPNSFQSWFNFGLAALQAEQAGQAHLAFTKALEIEPSSKQCFWGLALALGQLGRFEEAGTHFSQILEMDTGDADALFHLGYTRFRKGNWSGAIECFMNCLARRRKWVQPWIYLGLAQWSAGDFDAADSSFAKALQRDPISVPALQCKTAVALMTGNASAAVEYEAQLADTGHSQPEFCYNLGVLQHSSNLLEDALQSYRRAITKRPTFGPALLNLGCALIESGKEEEARNVWQIALAVDPGLAANYFSGASQVL